MSKLSRFQKLQTRAGDISRANGFVPASWEDNHSVPTKLALLHSEISEALEEFRKDNKVAFAEELADVFIRLVDLCDALDIDLEVEVVTKMVKNAGRTFKHGGKRV